MVTQKLSTEERTRSEHLPSALAFASGSAVTQAVISSLVKAGGHIISVNDVYGGTYRYLTKVAPTAGIQTTFVEMAMSDSTQDLKTDLNEVANRIEAAFRPETQASYTHTLSECISHLKCNPVHSSFGLKPQPIRRFAWLT